MKERVKAIFENMTDYVATKYWGNHTLVSSLGHESYLF